MTNSLNISNKINIDKYKEKINEANRYEFVHLLLFKYFHDIQNLLKNEEFMNKINDPNIMDGLKLPNNVTDLVIYTDNLQKDRKKVNYVYQLLIPYTNITIKDKKKIDENEMKYLMNKRELEHMKFKIKINPMPLKLNEAEYLIEMFNYNENIDDFYKLLAKDREVDGELENKIIMKDHPIPKDPYDFPKFICNLHMKRNILNYIYKIIIKHINITPEEIKFIEDNEKEYMNNINNNNKKKIN